MCRRPESPRHVVIAGAGPAGLLMAALLMQRNKEVASPLYRITLIDNRQDFGKLTKEELTTTFRSWMLGLAGHGLGALRQVKGLYEDYCGDAGIQLESLSIHLGASEMKTPNTDPEDERYVEGFIVDRNFIVAAIARFVNDGMTEEQAHMTTLYEHKVLYVDYDNRRVLARSQDNEETYLDYDLLIGCDGARSVVREALVKRHSTFEMDVGDIFQTFKAVHVQRPENLDPASMHILPACLPSMQGIALPETGDMLNISMGIGRHLFDAGELAKELISDDPKVVAEYVKKNFKAFDLIDYDDFAKQWVDQRWNRTAQVHCNFYHSTDINVVLMGDAAHATSPSIGQGMNQALKDAQTFYLLLREHEDDLSLVLPAYSKSRVKEGNSLSDLAMHLYCMDTKQQLMETIHMIVRSTLHKWIPSLVMDHPQSLIGRVEYSLSDVYDRATQLGIIPKQRRINDKIRQEHFEQETGMVASRPSSRFPRKEIVIGGLVVAAAVALGIRYHAK